jgi:hypothetical protein
MIQVDLDFPIVAKSSKIFRWKVHNPFSLDSILTLSPKKFRCSSFLGADDLAGE